jgi:hypothetical protein
VPIITSNISGYGSNSVIGISGSIVFQNPQIPGSDTVFFVSGSNSARAVFAGTMVVSGSLVTSGSIFLGDSTNEDILQVKATSFLLGPTAVGTTSTSSLLTVSGSSTPSTPTMVVREGVASPTGGAGTFDVQNSAGISLFFVSGSGNIGIGTTTPGEKLSVHDGGPDRIGLGVVNATATTTLYLGSKNSGAGYRTLQFNRTTGNLDLYYGNVGSAMTSALTVDLNGKIGIGTSGLTAPLNIFGTSTTTPSSTVGMVRFLGSATNALIFGTLTESPFSSYVQSGGSGTYPLSLNPLGGNVGIGTTTNLSTLSVNGSFSAKSPSTISAATYTVAATDYSLRFTTTNCTVTLPAASSFPGRILIMNTITANSVTSNTSNVIPLGSNTAGTAILAATLGKFTMIQSNGTNWVTLMSN